MIRLLLFIPIVILDTMVSATVVMFGGLFNPYSALNTFIMQTWAKVILLAAGVKMEISGIENIKKGESSIVVANHQSLMDIPVATAALPIALRILAKKELFKIPFLGWGMKGIGILKIDRSNSKKALEILKAAEDIIRKNQLSILIFPEGTRSKDGKIHAFKKGAFVLAKNTGLDISPVSISGTRNILPKGKIRVNSGNVKVVIHPTISTAEFSYENRKDFVEKTQHTIMKGFVENYE
jgi:1-acyl-sn-glycerol-3-phosphate acyltransferase